MFFRKSTMILVEFGVLGARARGLSVFKLKGFTQW